MGTLDRSPAGAPAPASSRPEPEAVTLSGLVVHESYGPEDARTNDPADPYREDPRIGSPGAYPYTRGLHPMMYRERLWTMRQFAGFGSAVDTNRRFRYLLETAGEEARSGLSTAFDLPTLMGRDSDDPLSAGEVGRCGVAIDTIEDMDELFADLPLDEITVSMTINGPAAVVWAMYLVVARRRGFAWEDLGGTLQNDILKEFHSQNEFIYPPEPSLRLVVDTIEFQIERVPQWNSVSISGYHIREAGSTATQELAFTLRDGMEYVERCQERGLDVDAFAPRLSFFFNSHNEFFEEICKLRAARRMWARVMRERYGARNERSWWMRAHVQTAGCSLTRQQPLNNTTRVAYQAMAAVLGGCQSLHTDAMDEALGLPTETAARVALRTQQILAHETGVHRTVDPLGGSWFVEALTDEMEREAESIISEIDAMGGVVEGIRSGYFRRAIAEASYRFERDLESGERIVVGVNAYEEGNEEQEIERLEVPPEVEEEQRGRLADFRGRRDAGDVERAREAIRDAARSGENVMPALIDGADRNCTLGEMVNAMADVFGRYSGGPEW